MNILTDLHKDPSSFSSYECLAQFKKIYGEDKVNEVCFRYRIFQKVNRNTSVKVKEIKKLQQGLNDIRFDDLELFIVKLKENKDSFTVREKDVFEALDKDVLEQLILAKTASELKAPVFNLLVDLFKKPNKAYENFQFDSNLPLSKITSLPAKYFLHGCLSYSKGRSLEDEERLKIYEEIQTLKSDDQSRYCELLTKILSKKHLYYEQKDSKKCSLGMLVPAPPSLDGESRWYMVSEILDSGLGKFAYRLVPATKCYSEDMSEVLLYRSSATFPTARDSFTSFISDFNVLPPGYISRKCSLKKELGWYKEPSRTNEGAIRPLLLTGHSLGGSNCQIALMNLYKSGNWIDRKINLELFDSPTIRDKDAKKFASWYNQQNFSCSLKFKYFVSKGDLVPLAGSLIKSTYLGNYVEKELFSAKVYKMKLLKKDRKEITGLGPHARMFFRGNKDVDFRKKKISLHQYDQENKYARIVANITKAAFAMLFIWPVIGTFGGLKRFFYGRRYHSPIILRPFKG